MLARSGRICILLSPTYNQSELAGRVEPVKDDDAIMTDKFLIECENAFLCGPNRTP